MKSLQNGTIYFTLARCRFTEDLERDKQSLRMRHSFVVDPVMYFIYVPRVEYDVLNLMCVADSVVNVIYLT